MRALRSLVLLAALAFAAPGLAQINPGTTPLTGPKGGTGNAFMQFAGPASSLKTFTLPNASGTVGVLNAIGTWTAVQSFNDGTVVLLGSSSGSSTLKAPATGGGTATLFAGSDTIVGRASTDTLTNKTINGAALSGTLSGSPTFSGAPLFTGLSAGTCSTGVGLDASNNFIKVSCPGAAGSVQIGTTSVTGSSTNNILFADASGKLQNQVTANFLLAGTGISLSGTTVVTITAATPAFTQQSPATPTGTTSASAVMMGIGKDQAGAGAHPCTITPLFSGRVEAWIYASSQNSANAAVNSFNLLFGTGTAPSNGAAGTGTQVGPQRQTSQSGTTLLMPVAVGGIVSGLALGTAAWFDLSLATSTGTASAQVPGCTLREF